MSLFLREAPQHPSSNLLPFEYRLVRSARRKRVSIEVSKAKVVVRIPMFVEARDVEYFVREKSSWIQQKIAQQSQQINKVPVRTYAEGSQFPCLGQLLCLRINRQSQSSVVQYGDELIVGLSTRSRLKDEEQARRLVVEWYQRKALHVLTRKTDEVVHKLGLAHQGVTIKATRSKWGHCTAHGAIQYNWQILLAPEPIVDYLVAHEVSHLRHHNHGVEFWLHVANLCPEYKYCRAWLKACGIQLIL